MSQPRQNNPLGHASIPRLMLKFAVPSIIAMLVGSLYNIVDQFFIGRAVGTLGNAATNVAFPLTTSCLSLALMFGVGGASCFNLAMGSGDREQAPAFMGNALVMLALCGTALSLVTLTFLDPLLTLFGSPAEVMPYAREYVSITALGFPFLLLTTGGGHLIRADGSPRMTMVCSLTGAIVNTILDALFVMVFHWGMAGAAWATIIGQILSAVIVLVYMRRPRTVQLRREHFRLRLRCVSRIASIGAASFFNQVAMMVVQITLNNALRYWGALSVYGESIPLAVAGIVMKVNQVSFSVVIGISQGAQPIESFNYGAKQYPRVRRAYLTASALAGCVSLVSFTMFQLFPRQIIAVFGQGSEEYFRFGVSYFRVFLFFTWLMFLQPITSTFFTSIGKPLRGIFLSLTRQIIFLLPMIVFLPRFMGIDGILYAGPVADLLSAVCAVVMALFAFRDMRRLESPAV